MFFHLEKRWIHHDFNYIVCLPLGLDKRIATLPYVAIFVKKKKRFLNLILKKFPKWMFSLTPPPPLLKMKIFHFNKEYFLFYAIKAANVQLCDLSFAPGMNPGGELMDPGSLPLSPRAYSIQGVSPCIALF